MMNSFGVAPVAGDLGFLVLDSVEIEVALQRLHVPIFVVFYFPLDLLWFEFVDIFGCKLFRLDQAFEQLNF